MTQQNRTITLMVDELAWQPDHGDGYTLFRVETPVGRFVYGTDRRGLSYHQAPTPVCETNHASEADAKAAAEADHLMLVREAVAKHGTILLGR